MKITKIGNQTALLIGNDRSGITIIINKKRRNFYIEGHYDSLVGIDGEYIDLDEFLLLFSKRNIGDNETM